MEVGGPFPQASKAVGGEGPACETRLRGDRRVGRRCPHAGTASRGSSAVGTPPAAAPLGERQLTPLPPVQLTGGVRASARLRAQPCSASSASTRDVGVAAAARTACQVSLAAPRALTRGIVSFGPFPPMCWPRSRGGAGSRGQGDGAVGHRGSVRPPGESASRWAHVSGPGAAAFAGRSAGCSPLRDGTAPSRPPQGP